jgi:hypothetical protein
METFPSTEWFARLAERMAAQSEKYRKLGVIDLTLVVRIEFPDHHTEMYALDFDAYGCRDVKRVDRLEDVGGRHPVVIEGEFSAWKEMVENIRAHGAADLTHTLNYLTLPDWPLRLAPVNPKEDQLDVDRFYRYNESLQEFFNEAAAIDTRFVET